MAKLSDQIIHRNVYSSILLATSRPTIVDDSTTKMHIAKGVMRSSAAPVSMPGGNPNINTDHAMSNMLAAQKSTKLLLREFSCIFSLFDNIVQILVM
jgi:hypothetical protein